MKIGILSMQRINNYGSFLQAYALSNLIKSFGHETEFVDYKVGRPILTDKASKRQYSKKLIEKRLFDIASNFRPLFGLAPDMIKPKLKGKYLYNKEYLPILGVTAKKKYRTHVDALVIGSDEVFNCTQSNPDVGYSPELFGANNNAKKLISYAASFGNTTIDDLRRLKKYDEVEDMINRFDSISVRDKNSAEIVKSMTGRSPQVHLDPALIYDFSEEIPDRADIEDYLLVYAYRNRITKDEQNIICEFAKKEGLKVLCIGGRQPFADINFQGSPFEVLDYFKKARFVVTDTFHGTIFSVINHKKFVTFIREGHGKMYGNKEKLHDLLVRLGLTDRSVTINDDVINTLKSEIDYDKVDSIRRSETKKTIDYLRSTLEIDE